jgi:hypothetical protein
MGNIALLGTFGLLLATVWIAIMRPRMRIDNSWPLFYYLGLTLYLNSVELVLEPYVVYVAVICALLLRFEFMNERVVLLVRLVEFCAMARIGWRLFGALMKAF